MTHGKPLSPKDLLACRISTCLGEVDGIKFAWLRWFQIIKFCIKSMPVDKRRKKVKIKLLWLKGKGKRKYMWCKMKAVEKKMIPVRITDSLQYRLFSLRLNKEKTDDDLLPLRFPDGAPFDLFCNSWYNGEKKIKHPHFHQGQHNIHLISRSSLNIPFEFLLSRGD